MSEKNRIAADVLFNVATMLELSGDNPYRIRAYRRAARVLLRGEQITEETTHGLGKRLTQRLKELTQPESQS